MSHHRQTYFREWHFKRFERSITKKQRSGCWEWNKKQMYFSVRGTRFGARHWIYQWRMYQSGMKEMLKSGTHLVNTCGNKRCVNPDHLEKAVEYKKLRT